MWPQAFWERRLRAADPPRGGARAAVRARPTRTACEKAFAFCDLLVIGAGPAGLMAALTAGRAGARVILADEDFLPGGRLNAERLEVGGRPGADWAAAAAAELAALPNVRLMPRTTVTGAYDGGTYGALERVAEHLAPPPRRRAAAVLLAHRRAPRGARRRGDRARRSPSRTTTGPG